MIPPEWWKAARNRNLLKTVFNVNYTFPSRSEYLLGAEMGRLAQKGFRGIIGLEYVSGACGYHSPDFMPKQWAVMAWESAQQFPFLWASEMVWRKHIWAFSFWALSSSELWYRVASFSPRCTTTVSLNMNLFLKIKFYLLSSRRMHCPSIYFGLLFVLLPWHPQTFSLCFFLLLAKGIN